MTYQNCGNRNGSLHCTKPVDHHGKHGTLFYSTLRNHWRVIRWANSYSIVTSERLNWK